MLGYNFNTSINIAGVYKTPKDQVSGSTPPFLVHSIQKAASKNDDTSNVPTYTPDSKIDFNIRFSEGLANPYAGPKDFTERKNPCGFCVRATKNGSMTLDTIFDFACHFVRHLPVGQGKGGDGHILFLDGHASRWNLAAIEYLMENNVFPFFLPSHTSIWTQPNDNGANLRYHKCFEQALKRLRSSGSKNTIRFYNSIIRIAWIDFIERERRELLHAGENSTTSAWRVCGLFPFNPNPQNWEEVMTTLGKQNEELKKDKDGNVKEEIEYEIVIKDNMEVDKILTKEEKEKLQTGMKSTTSAIEAAYFHLRGMLAKWREGIQDAEHKSSPPSTPVSLLR